MGRDQSRKMGAYLPDEAHGRYHRQKAQRQDYGGGVINNHFYLNNCGFFSPNDQLDTLFSVDKDQMVKPEIDLEKLD